MSNQELDITDYGINEEIKKKTGSYIAIDVTVVPMELHKVVDFQTGGKRSRRLGMSLSANIITDLTKEPEPVIMGRGQEHLFIDADTLDDLKERAHAELDAIFLYTKDVISGKAPKPGVRNVLEDSDDTDAKEGQDLEDERDRRSAEATAPVPNS